MRTRIIGELASNHGGDLELAKDLIAACADYGADAVKVQAYQTKYLASADPQHAWLRAAELSEANLAHLHDFARGHKLDFLVSVFDVERARFVKSLGCRDVKIGSGEIRRLALISTCIALFDVVWLGAGVDPRRAVRLTVDHPNVRPVFGVSQYPAPSVYERGELAGSAIL